MIISIIDKYAVIPATEKFEYVAPLLEVYLLSYKSFTFNMQQQNFVIQLNNARIRMDMM